MFSGILKTTSVVYPGNEYTITMDTHETLFLFHTASWLMSKLNTDTIKDYIKIRSIIRPNFSNRIVIHFNPNRKVTINDLIFILTDQIKKYFPKINFIQIETGTASTKPGGLPTILPDTGKVIGETVGEIIKPLIPILVLSVLGLYFLQRTKEKII